MSQEPNVPKEWSDAEQWAWKEIRAGRIVDFEKRYKEYLNPKKSDGWDNKQKGRLISKNFIDTILTDECFLHNTPCKGVCINQAYFGENVDLQHARLERQLWLEHCRIDGDLNMRNLQVNGWFSLEGSWIGGTIDLNGSIFDSFVSLNKCEFSYEANFTAVQIGGQLSMSGSKFDSTLIMDSIEVGQHLLMNNKANFKEVDLSAAKIEGRINMSGSKFDSTLIMDSIEVGQHLLMNDKGNFQEVDLISAKIGGQLSMSNSTFHSKLRMANIEVGQHLLMNNKANFKEVDLSAAKIEGRINMSGSKFDSTLIMDSIEVGQHLFMNDKGNFQEVDLLSAKIGGQLSISNSTFHSKLRMASIEVGQHLLMNDKANFQEVDLTAAKIGGQLSMNKSTFHDKLTMDSMNVAMSLFMRKSNFPEDQEVVLHFSKIGLSIDLSGSTIAALDLTSTTITSEIRLGSAKGHDPTNWIGESKMILRNTIVGAIQDAAVTLDSWPENLELEGFEFIRLGGFGAEGAADILIRKSEWFIKWLERDKTFSPQPYEFLANVLHDAGFPKKANAILYAARKRTRKEACVKREGKPREKLRWFGLTLLQLTIGYGLGARYFRVLWWIGGFTLIGFLVLIASINIPNENLFKWAWASFDQVLPIVQLNKAHEELILKNCNNWAISYFYFQKLMGYLLGGFLGAGLAGLTQKS